MNCSMILVKGPLKGMPLLISRNYNFGSFQGYVIDEASSETIKTVSRMSGIKYIEQDSIGHIDLHSIDNANTKLTGSRAVDGIGIQQSPGSWGLPRISSRGLPGPNDPYYYTEPSGVNSVVYVLDTGVQGNHSDFQGRASVIKNFIMDEPDTDLNSHGTHVSGIVGSKTYGVAKNVKIKSIKV